ncbi:MAG: NACHT domain-containing protein [Chloroflexaceae bacterium]|nr:NACHT domain-containing protein [Chloroflexaceae bacterium]
MGTPGAGKTTLLLELARDLTARALADATHPIPVLVNLSTWGSNPRPLAEWLAEAMRDAVGTSKQFAQQLIAGDQLLLLLDGLDEVAAAQRAACVKAINTFLAERMQQRAAVCCRLKEYEAIGEKLTFESALQVEPLDEQQIADVLDAGGDMLAGVRQALHDEALFRDLLTTPLMLNIVILAYSGGEAVQIAGQSPPELRRALFAAYVQRMLTRHTERLDARYRPKVQDWLAWLAHQMRRDSTTDFRVGYMQPTMLKQRWLYRLFVGLVFGLIGGLIGGLVGGLVFGLIGGLVGGLVGSSSSIQPVEGLQWSWQHARAGCLAGCSSGWCSGWAACWASGYNPSRLPQHEYRIKRYAARSRAG